MLTVPPVLTIEPASYAPGSTPQQPNLALGTGTVTAGPDRVWDLVRPVTLDGAQAYRDPSGQIAVQTTIGTILVQASDASVPLGVPVSIRLAPGDPPLVTFMPSQSNAGGSGAAQQAPVEDETPAVLLSDTVASSQSLVLGQVIVLTAMAGQIGQASENPAPIAAAAQEEISAAEATEPALVAASLAGDATEVIAQIVGGPPPAASGSVPTSAATTFAGLASVLADQVSSTEQKVVPVAADLSLAQATSQAEAVAASILSAAEGIPGASSTIASATVVAVSSLASQPQIAGGAVAPGNAAPVDTRSDLDGLPAALAAQLPAEQPPGASPVQSTGSSLAPENDAGLSMRILAIVPPGESMLPVPAGAIVARVEGSTLAGQPILQSGERSFVIEGSAAVPLGTRIVLEPAPQLAPHFAPLPPPLDPIAGRSWPALAAAIPALAESHFALAEMLRLAVPQEGPLLGPVLLLFAAGLRRGDVRGWLGDGPLNELQRAGHGDLASMLSSDFEHASRQSTQALDDGWHTLPIPIFAEGAMSRIQLHLRRYKSSGGQSRDTKDNHDDVRFVVEAEPSATGPVQLDGLVRRPHDAPAALDLIVRSQAPLAPEMRSDITGLFANSLAVTGLKGAIVFQGGMNWIKVARDRASASVMA